MNNSSKIIILTGQKGVGKSTLCMNIRHSAIEIGATCGGIITYKSHDHGIIIEDVDTGETEIMASRHPVYSGPRVGHYYFNRSALIFGLSAIKKGLGKDIVFIDELGHLEVRGEGFAETFEYLMKYTFNQAVVVIREELLGTLIPKFEIYPHIVRITLYNRDDVSKDIFSLLSNQDI